MGIRYSQLPKTNVPTGDDWVALLDNDSAILKTATIENIVKSVIGPTDMGDTSITGIGDGTVTGAIEYIYNTTKNSIACFALTEAQYNALPASTKNDGNLRYIT